MPKYLMRKMGMSSLGVVLALHSVAPAYALHPLGRNDTPETLAYYGNDPSFSFVKEVTLQRTQRSAIKCSATKIGETATEDVYLSASHCFSGRPPSGNVRHYELHPEYTMYPWVSEIVSIISIGVLLISTDLLSLLGFTMPSPVSHMLGVMSGVMAWLSAHNELARRSYKYDLAVVFTDKTDAPIAPLYQGDYAALDHQKATVVGYGVNYHNGLEEEGFCSLKISDYSPTRQAAEVEVTYNFVSSSLSSWLLPFHQDERGLFLHETAPLSHNQKPYATLTQGDSGGPLLWRSPQGAWEVIGVASTNWGTAIPIQWYSSLLNLLQNQAGRDYFTEDREENAYYKEFHEACATSFINPLDGACSLVSTLCYGAKAKWEAIDHQFIHNIFQKYNVTTTR